MEFVHIGVPTKKVQENETYIEGMKVYVTDPENHDYKFEYLRFDEDSWMPKKMQGNPHIAIKVHSIEEELKKCEEILVEPTKVNENTTLCFAVRDGVIFELMEIASK
ncbi:hypothetical protein [Clostridium sp.]|uniref:hypothetical protein n=1 Tax=Clostridium sp. TaxID=1506 RepID=UPI00321627C8